MDLEYNILSIVPILFVRSSRRNCSVLDPTVDTKKKRKEMKGKMRQSPKITLDVSSDPPSATITTNRRE